MMFFFIANDHYYDLFNEQVHKWMYKNLLLKVSHLDLKVKTNTQAVTNECRGKTCVST